MYSGHSMLYYLLHLDLDTEKPSEDVSPVMSYLGRRVH